MYTWDLEDLKRKKLELEKMRSTRKKKLSEEKMLRLRHSINNYNLLLSLFNNDFDENDEIEISDRDLVSKYFNNLYKMINPDIITSVINSSSIFELDSIKDLYDDKTSSIILLDDVILMTKDIFSSFGNKELMDKVNKILDPNNHLLHFSLDDEFSCLDANYTGFSCKDYFNNLGYAIIYSNNKIRDLYTLVHEIFHLVIKDELPALNTEDKYFISEVEGSFADLIVTDYLFNNGIFKDDALVVDVNNFNTIKYFTRNLYIAKSFHNCFIGDDFDINKINSLINFNYSIDEDILRSSILSFDRDLCYSFSYLIALDLFFKYKNGYKNITDDLAGIATSKRPFIMLDRYDVTFYKDGYHNLNEYQKILVKKQKR